MLNPMVRLMMRLLLKKKLQDEHVIPTTVMDNYSLVDALESHMAKISEEQRVLYAQSAYLVKLVLPSLDINIKEVTENFSKLASNSHTICNSELLSLGIGLYPVLSIINHSCKPNSVWAFEGPIAFVRALQPIEKDTEVPLATAAANNIIFLLLGFQFGSPASGTGRARRDAAERAMQGWHSQKLVGNSEVGDPTIRDKYNKSIGNIKRKKTSGLDSVMKGSHKKALKPQKSSSA